MDQKETKVNTAVRNALLDQIRKAYPELNDLPDEVLLNVGAYDTDTAGGCG